MTWLAWLKQRIPKREKLLASRWLRWLAPWLGHSALWHWSRRGVALGVALGVFFGLLIPLAQIPATALAAIVLRANLPAAAASTLITNPVTFGPLYFAAYRLGSWLTGDQTLPVAAGVTPEADNMHTENGTSLWHRVLALGRPLLVGLTIIATLMGVATYFLISLAWRCRVMWLRRSRTRRRRQEKKT